MELNSPENGALKTEQKKKELHRKINRKCHVLTSNTRNISEIYFEIVDIKATRNSDGFLFARFCFYLVLTRRNAGTMPKNRENIVSIYHRHYYYYYCW